MGKLVKGILIKVLVASFAVAILFMFMPIGKVFASTTPDKTWGGTGTETDPFTITSAEGLIALRERILKDGVQITEGVFFALKKDIDLSSYCGKGIGDWTPISAFTGTFDGEGHKITGLYIGNGGVFSGLFISNQGIVKNLNVEGYIKGSETVGGIFGWNRGRIENCSFKGTVISTGKEAAGIVGSNGGAIIGCKAEGDIQSTGRSGGIAGFSQGSPIENCSFSGNVKATSESMFSQYVGAGGIVGYSNIDCSIYNCSFLGGTVSGHRYIAGIVGWPNSIIENCVSYGTVNGYACVGGIAGENCLPIRKCENYGTVTASYAYAGGIVGHTFAARGYKCTVENCVNHGDVTVALGFCGGIVGGAEYPIIECTNYGTVTAKNTVGGIAGDIDRGIKRCVNKGKVNGNASFGDLVGNDNGASVTIKLNGGKGEDLASKIGTIGGVAPECEFEHKDGLVFAAWNTAADGSGTSYLPGEDLPDKDITLYAIWLKKKETLLYTHYNGTQCYTDMFCLTGDEVYLQSGFYVVRSGKLTLNHRLEIRGNVNLVLGYDTTLNATKGIHVPAGSSLTIWEQIPNDCVGILNASAYGIDCVAGIGGNNKETNGRITINGGIVNAQGGWSAAGIGSGTEANGGIIEINGGLVTAKGHDYGAGIGGGDRGKGGSITINGGTVIAYGREGSAGIGGGDYGDGGEVIINGGTVKAYGSVRSRTGQASAGIGAGRPNPDSSYTPFGGNCTINGGYVTVAPGNTDSSKGAQAIGTNYRDRSKAGSLTFGDVKVIPANTGKAVNDYTRRADGCRGGEVNIVPCLHHDFKDKKCIYCSAPPVFESFFRYGSGTEQDPFDIYNDDELSLISEIVNKHGFDTQGVWFRLKGERFNLYTPIGTADNPFRGSFEGNGAILNIALTAEGDYCAPFAYGEYAKIYSLEVTGTINSAYSYTAGIIGNAKNCRINDCKSTVCINVLGSNCRYNSGMVGKGNSVEINYSSFKGSTTGYTSVKFGGFIGLAENDGCKCLYCVFDPGNLKTGSGSSTFMGNAGKIEGCYFLNGLHQGEDKGIEPVRVIAGENVEFDLSHSGYAVTSSIKCIPVNSQGLTTSGIIYEGCLLLEKGKTAALKIKTPLPGGYTSQLKTSAGALEKRDGQNYNYTASSSDAVITV